MKNGVQYDSIWFNMPLVQDTKISFKINDEKQVLLADSIECIILWSKQHPEEKHIFKSFRPNYFNRKDSTFGASKDPIWLCLKQVGKNCTTWLEIGRPSFKKGKLRFNYNKMYSYLSMLHIMKNTETTPCHVPDKSKDEKMWVELFFSDDPALIEKFKAGEFEAKDWGYKYIDYTRIIDEYAPKQ